MNLSDHILTITIIFYRITWGKASLCQRQTQEQSSLAETALGKPQATRNEMATGRKWGLIEWWEDKNGTTWPATQVGLRPVEAGLGGHDAAVSGVDAGVKKASSPISKRCRLAKSDYASFSGFDRFERENIIAKKNPIGTFSELWCVHDNRCYVMLYHGYGKVLWLWFCCFSFLTLQ